MNAKKWLISTLALLLAALALMGALTITIDPYFHYHAPIKGLAYELSDTRQRYINDGISKHFEYDAMLTGTSMMENSRVSTFEELFDVTAVKVPYEGSSMKETDQNLCRAIAANPDLKMVFRSIDYFIIILEKDEQLYPEELYPYYLYDENPFNDVSYVFNKTVFLENTLPVISRSMRGEAMTDFDDYSLMPAEQFGIKAPEDLAPINPDNRGASPEQLEKTAGNILQNVRQTALDNPQIEFYYVISPYSLVYWNRLRAAGTVDEHLDVEQKAAELLVDLENVHLFSFYDCPEIIGNLELYMDECHYNADVLDMIFEYMAKGEHRLTEDNYVEAFDRARKLFKEGDLPALIQ